MGLIRSLEGLRYRSVWSDPRRKLLTLEGFARTEEDGGRDLLAAARRAEDAELRGHLERHARDELRHAALFRGRVAELEAASSRAGEVPDKPYDIVRWRRGVEVDAHGFYTAGLFDELGEIPYVAMLHVAERHAADLLALHRDLNEGDCATVALFDDILRDEKYHIAYTGTLLARWRARGRGREVEAGLAAARRSRLMGAWARVGTRSAAGLGRALLYAMYWTVLVPFALVARRARARTGWQPPSRPGGDPSSQY
jgi:hypothetical protein